MKNCEEIKKQLTAEVAVRGRMEDKLKLMEFSIDNISDAVYWITMDGRFWNVNAAACKMLGYSREELLSMSVRDIDPGYTHEDGRRDVEELKRTGTLRLKRPHRAGDGRVIPVEITSNYFTYNDVEYICCIVRDITECVKAEKEAAFFRTLIEYTSDPVYVSNSKDPCRLSYVNEAACQHFGMNLDQVLSMRLPDWDPSFDIEHFDEAWERLRSKKSVRFETQHRVASGDLVPVEVTANYLELDGEELVAGYFHDISRRKAMEAELRLAREELERRVEERTAELAETVRALRFTQFAIDRALDQAFCIEEDGRFFYVNDAACRNLGYSREELLAMRVTDIDPVITWERMLEIKSVLDATGSATHETVHRRRDGTTFPVEITANYVEFQGKPHTFSFVKDITERKRADDAIRASEIEKSLILNSTMDYVMYHDPDMKIVWGNWKAAELTNLPVEDLIGRHCWEVIHRRDKPCEGCPVVLARDTGEPQKMERYSPNGLILNMRAYPIRSEDGRLLGIAEFASDITEQKRAEDVLRKAHDELETRVRERTEQLASLAAQLSLAEERERRRIATELHDQVGQTLILSKIKLGSLSHSIPAEDFRKVAGEIREYLDRSIQDIRSLTFQLSPPLLYELGFEAAVEWLGEEFREKYGFDVEFQSDGRKKPFDEETSIALYQMARELLVNVVKHAKAKKVIISVEKVPNKIRVIVADDGSGFDKMNGMRRKKRGFGLFNIRQRIEYMGGNLAIESEIGRGTRVTLLLPFRKKKKSTDRRKS